MALYREELLGGRYDDGGEGEEIAQRHDRRRSRMVAVEPFREMPARLFLRARHPIPLPKGLAPVVKTWQILRGLNFHHRCHRADPNFLLSRGRP